MVKSTSLDRPVPSTQLAPSPRMAKETRLEAERMHDVLLLLEHLINREETTAKLILDCLYDVGAVNLINQKLRNRSLNRFGKWIARLSKPAFKLFALRWMKKNCPHLIADWLHKQVKFEKHPQPQVEPRDVEVLVSDPVITQSTSLAELKGYAPDPTTDLTTTLELSRLRSQVKLLTRLLVGVSLALGGAVVWLSHKPVNQPIQASSQFGAAVSALQQSSDRWAGDANPESALR